MVRETKAQADKKAADVERKRANRKQEHLNSGGDSQGMFPFGPSSKYCNNNSTKQRKFFALI